jgi:hypothetical protein
MRCLACQSANRPGAKFCEQCGTRLEVACPSCGTPLSAAARFCSECGAVAAAAGTAAAAPGGGDVRRASPTSYTPSHLVARILRERGALTGERK